jgi:crossover junction endodeoxyribonuclease RusA
VVGSPDIDKVCRAVLDALTGILYRDDAQVVALSAVKTYADGYGAPGTTSVAITHEPLLEGDSDGITH